MNAPTLAESMIYMLLSLCIMQSADCSAETMDQSAGKQLNSPVTVVGGFIKPYVFRVTVKNTSADEVLIYRHRTVPPFFRMVLLNAVGDEVEGVTWHGDSNKPNIHIAVGDASYFDVNVGDWYPSLQTKHGRQCLDFLWAWRIELDDSKKQLFFGGAEALNCDYANTDQVQE